MAEALSNVIEQIVRRQFIEAAQVTGDEARMLQVSMEAFVRFAMLRYGLSSQTPDWQMNAAVRAIMDEFVSAVRGVLNGAKVAEEFGG